MRKAKVAHVPLLLCCLLTGCASSPPPRTGFLGDYSRLRQVEDGKIRYGIRNFRFNESLIDLLNCAEMLGPAERASGEEAAPMVVPALKVGSFHFTEVTKF